MSALTTAEIAEHIERRGIPGLPDFDSFRVNADGSVFAAQRTPNGTRFFQGQAVGWSGRITITGRTFEVAATPNQIANMMGAVYESSFDPGDRYDLTWEDTYA